GGQLNTITNKVVEAAKRSCETPPNEVNRHNSRRAARYVKGYTRVYTLSMKSPCTHRGCRDLVFASVEDVTEKLPTFLLVDILGCGFDWNAVADQLSTHFQYCS